MANPSCHVWNDTYWDFVDRPVFVPQDARHDLFLRPWVTQALFDWLVELPNLTAGRCPLRFQQNISCMLHAHFWPIQHLGCHVDTRERVFTWLHMCLHSKENQFLVCFLHTIYLNLTPAKQIRRLLKHVKAIFHGEKPSTSLGVCCIGSMFIRGTCCSDLNHRNHPQEHGPMEVCHHFHLLTPVFKKS